MGGVPAGVLSNMSLYHLPFLADVGRNKLHKDYTNIGIGEEPNRSDNLLLLLSPLLSYYFCHYCTLNISSPLILSVTNMSLYHLHFLADVGRNKLYKDYTNIGIGKEPNRSDNLLLVASFSSFLLFLFLSLLFLTLIYAIYTKFYFIFFYLLLFYSKIPLTFCFILRACAFHISYRRVRCTFFSNTRSFPKQHKKNIAVCKSSPSPYGSPK